MICNKKYTFAARKHQKYIGPNHPQNVVVAEKKSKFVAVREAGQILVTFKIRPILLLSFHKKSWDDNGLFYM